MRMQVPRRGGREFHRSPNPRSSALASERLVDLAPGPTGNNGADWKLRLETTLILSSVSAYSRGARLMAVITQAGIGWTLARTWEGSRALKRQGGASRRCPICRAKRNSRR
jgi:hypothetical protein